MVSCACVILDLFNNLDVGFYSFYLVVHKVLFGRSQGYRNL